MEWGACVWVGGKVGGEWSNHPAGTGPNPTAYRSKQNAFTAAALLLPLHADPVC